MASDGRVDPGLVVAVLGFVAGRPMNVAVTCRRFGVSRKTFYKYVSRYRQRGLDGFAADSRRPHHSPTRTSEQVLEAIVAARVELKGSGFDYGAWAIREHLKAEAGVGVVPSEATINRVLAARGLREIVPARRPRSCRTCSMTTGNASTTARTGSWAG